MTTKINHEWTYHCGLRLAECAYTAAMVRLAVEEKGAHLWSDRHAELKQAIADLQAVQAIVEKRIADETPVTRRAA